jgi:FAD/FMN-containing dehydrogenase
MQPIRTIKTVKMDKTAFTVFSSFAEADAADRAYWHARTPLERLEALELMRQSAYGYDDPTASRLERVLEFAHLK